MKQTGTAADRLARIKQGPMSTDARRVAQTTRSAPRLRSDMGETSGAGIPDWIKSGPLLLVAGLIASHFITSYVFDYRQVVSQEERGTLHQSCIQVSKTSTDPDPMTLSDTDEYMLRKIHDRESALRYLEACAVKACTAKGRDRATPLDRYLSGRISALNNANEQFGSAGIAYMMRFHSSHQDDAIATTANELVADDKLSLTTLRADNANLIRVLISHQNRNLPLCLP